MRESGMSKAEVERATGSTIGAYDANFEVYKGEIFVIIGLSGSGKSTILRAINGLNEPTGGSVYLDGERISGMSSKQLREVRRRKIGMVFQHFGLLPTRTVMDNVTFGLEVKGVAASERREAGEEALREHVPRRVRRDLIADPRVVAPHRRRLELAFRDQEQVAPLVAPVIDELGPL